MTLNQESVGLYAETLVRQVHVGGHLLDYSAASLAVLDSLFTDSESPFSQLEESQRHLAVFYIGCYLGEVLVNELAGVWQFEESWFETTLLVPREHGGVQLRPFEKVLRRFTEGTEGNSLVAYFSGLQEHLQRRLPLGESVHTP